jgi:hypothetical protein
MLKIVEELGAPVASFIPTGSSPLGAGTGSSPAGDGPGTSLGKNSSFSQGSSLEQEDPSGVSLQHIGQPLLLG